VVRSKSRKSVKTKEKKNVANFAFQLFLDMADIYLLADIEILAPEEAC
jgi:hypothetical protein